ADLHRRPVPQPSPGPGPGPRQGTAGSGARDRPGGRVGADRQRGHAPGRAPWRGTADLRRRACRAARRADAAPGPGAAAGPRTETGIPGNPVPLSPRAVAGAGCVPHPSMPPGRAAPACVPFRAPAAGCPRKKKEPGTRPGSGWLAWGRGTRQHRHAGRVGGETTRPARTCSGSPGEARAHEPLGIAIDELHVAADAPVLVELGQRTDAAVELAVVLVAVLVTGHRVALEVRVQRTAHADLGAPAVVVEAVAGIELLIGHAGDQIDGRGNLPVVADAEAVLVEVDRGVIDLLVAVATEQVEVGGDGNRAVHAEPVGVGAVGVGRGVAALHVVVGHALGGRGGEGKGGQQGQGKHGILLHVDTRCLVVVCATTGAESGCGSGVTNYSQAAGTRPEYRTDRYMNFPARAGTFLALRARHRRVMTGAYPAAHSRGRTAHWPSRQSGDWPACSRNTVRCCGASSRGAGPTTTRRTWCRRPTCAC